MIMMKKREILENLVQKILSRYKTKKQKPIELEQYPYEKGDYRLNVHNEKAKEFYENSMCEVLDYSLEKTNNKNQPLELMRTKHCLKRAFLGCNGVKKLFLVDDKGYKYPLEFDCKNCEMVIKNK